MEVSAGSAVVIDVVCGEAGVACLLGVAWVVCACVLVAESLAVLVVDVEVVDVAGVVDCAMVVSSLPAVAAAAKVVDDGRAVLVSEVDVDVEVVNRLERVMLVLLPAGTLTLRRTFVHRRPLNVVTENDIRLAAL